jgi:hypothetical protein
LFLRLSGVGVCEVVVTSGAPCYGRLLKSGHYREGFSVQDICRGGLLCLVALIRKFPSFIEAAEVVVVVWSMGRLSLVVEYIKLRWKIFANEGVLFDRKSPVVTRLPVVLWRGWRDNHQEGLSQ